MRRFTKAPWMRLTEMQILKTRTKQYRVVRCNGIARCTDCDIKKHPSMCAKIKCNTFTNGYMNFRVLKEIV